MQTIVNETGSNLCLIHHTPLADNQRMRGHTVFLGALDMSIPVIQPKKGYVVITRKKDNDPVNDGADLKFKTQIRSFETGIDKEGRCLPLATLIV